MSQQNSSKKLKAVLQSENEKLLIKVKELEEELIKLKNTNVSSTKNQPITSKVFIP